MDLKRILITDEVSDRIVEALRAAHLSVDVSSDISLQKLLEVVKVSIH